MPTTSKRAFTLVELLVAVVVSGILVGITASTYSLFRRSMALDQGRVSLSQNARIALDRISRELRQTPAVVTLLPANPSDLSTPQPGELEFEDGHANDLTYRRYYLSGGTLKVDVKQYYFAYDPTTRVRWNEQGTGGVSPISNVISTNDIADNVQSISYYGSNEVQILVTMLDSEGQQFQLRTTVLGRNL
ncbi:MAG TPA: prepilin-type N-terminal cleavage/methylation domain-containing protein [Verrucomicrobiae bacterium]|nr:prepilin-type N-terminal cleavage/methylation domain-containing protein [Verrucomicrobiae bacterium]